MRKKQSSNNQQMSREELTRTQVLNLSDFERVAKYEKSVSKKPAIFLSVLGIFCIIAGLSYNSIMAFVIDKITPPAPQISKRITENKDLIETKNDIVTCHYTSIDANAGTELILDLNLIFYNNILDTCVKNMSFVTSLGKETTGQPVVDYYYPIFKSFEEMTIPGYTSKTNLINNGFETKTTMDLKTVNVESLTDQHKAYPATTVDFIYGEDKETATQRAISYGYTCE
jgi:hypothetical protein